MTTGYWCERCGARWGLLTRAVTYDDWRRRASDDCFAGRCFPIRQVLNEWAARVKADPILIGILDCAQVVRAIEEAELRWRRQLPPGDPNRLEERVHEPRRP